MLLKDNDVCRNDWPTGVIANVIPSADGRIRKAEVCIIKKQQSCRLHATNIRARSVIVRSVIFKT